MWFEQFLDQLAATNQEPLKDDWLAWARGRGLKIGRNEEIQAALRSQNRAALQRLLERGELDPAQRVEALVRLGHGGEALGEALGALGDGHSRDNREQLRRQAAEILERTPRACNWVGTSATSAVSTSRGRRCARRATSATTGTPISNWAVAAITAMRWIARSSVANATPG